MATAKSRSRIPRSRLVLLLLAVLALWAAWLVWGSDLRRTAATGAAYAARVGCSCRFVAGRSLDDCAKDKLDGMAMISLSEDAQMKSVTASVPLLASDTARYREGYGCLLQEWRD